MTTISPYEASRTLPTWRYVSGSLEVALTASDFAQAFEFLGRIADLAENQQHHPDIDIRYNRVWLRVTSHDSDGLTDRDITFARAADEIIEEFGLERNLASITRLQLAIDALDIPAVKPFWLALLGYGEESAEDIVDPSDVLPPFWFQQMDKARPERNTLHVDVYVPADRAEARMQAALDAGGTLVNEDHAPSFWVLADPEGNEACVCTWQPPAAAE